jgi:hypothetical protein
MTSFDNHFSVIGTLRYSDVRLDAIRTTVHFNRIDGKGLRANLYSGGEEHCRTMIRSENFNQRTRFHAVVGQRTIDFHGKLKRWSFKDQIDDFGTVEIEEFKEVNYFNHVDHSARPTRVTIHYLVSDSQLFRQRDAGYDTDSLDQIPTTERWDGPLDEPYHFCVHDWRVRASPVRLYLNLQEGVLTKYHVGIQLERTDRHTHLDKDFESSKSIIKALIQVLRVLEHRKIVTTSADIALHSDAGCVSTGRVYFNDPAPPIHRDRKMKVEEREEIIGSIAGLTEAYLSLQDDTRARIDKIIRRFTQSCDPSIFYEVRIVHLHACLELLIKEYTSSPQHGSFSKKHILACEEAGVDLFDFYDGSREAFMRQTETDHFLISRVLRAYLHDGEIGKELKDHDQSTAYFRGLDLARTLITGLLRGGTDQGL